jgi:hypothetical protein
VRGIQTAIVTDLEAGDRLFNAVSVAPEVFYSLESNLKTALKQLTSAHKIDLVRERPALRREFDQIVLDSEQH